MSATLSQISKSIFIILLVIIATLTGARAQTTSGIDTVPGQDLVFGVQGNPVGVWKSDGNLSIANNIQIGGNPATPCDATHEGGIRYNSATKAFEGCNGTAWGPMSTGAVHVLYNAFTPGTVTINNLYTWTQVEKFTVTPNTNTQIVGQINFTITGNWQGEKGAIKIVRNDGKIVYTADFFEGQSKGSTGNAMFAQFNDALTGGTWSYTIYFAGTDGSASDIITIGNWSIYVSGS